VLADFRKSATIAFKAAGETILLVGDTQGWLGQSLYLRDVCGREEGAPPPVDLAAEKRNGDFVRALIAGGIATAVHDLSDGGLAVALAEMAMASGLGATLDPARAPAHGFWFGEDQARYVVTVTAAQAPLVAERARKAGVAVRNLGATGGDALTLGAERPILVKSLAQKFEGWLPAYMAGQS
jgi:phosphoribosylformylglycinamidine synthase